MDDRTQNEPIEYARPGAEPAVPTRILVEKTSRGIRYTDPPGASESIRANYVFAGVAAAVAVFSLIAMIVGQGTTGGRLVGLAVSSIFIWMARYYFEGARRIAVSPTIVEIRVDEFHLTHPMEGVHHWPRSGVKVYSATSSIWRTKLVNFLGITAGGKNYKILEGRPEVEVKWLTSQLQHWLTIEQTDESDRAVE